jgi:hypothetical protein
MKDVTDKHGCSRLSVEKQLCIQCVVIFTSSRSQNMWDESDFYSNWSNNTDGIPGGSSHQVRPNRKAQVRFTVALPRKHAVFRAPMNGM